MHRILREALPEATGRSEFVIVVVADIRGFSVFSRQHESPDIAMYVKRVYLTLIDRYFPNAAFYKPTGDGLLVIIPFGESNLAEVANQTVQACLSCVREFGSFCSNDPMINFPTPQRIGFGLCRGTACCLASGARVLDYSGHLLNLATRLMGLARPSGVVLDGAFRIALLDPEIQRLFAEADVYLRGLAEESPLHIYYLRDVVEVPEGALRPLTIEKWETWSNTLALSKWRKYAPTLRIDLPGPLKRPDAVIIKLFHPPYRGQKQVKGPLLSRTYGGWEYKMAGADAYLRVDLESLLDLLKKEGVPSKAQLTLQAEYVRARR